MPKGADCHGQLVVKDAQVKFYSNNASVPQRIDEVTGNFR